ncbi:hypothetical protein AVEN_107916-1 [Araneus ventricosus]|uniref:Uncharacterized protein n=1 Tax=Araneus ventricosus TaxID=182803 RepID=A0A4Y2B8K6_ARAVE|nr:hypothetical protein AVEN_60331-1 [Araneus ventricosus]GBL87648.1 hypothetical protein AVEN_107916-1 [Araneus ventricosus]
MPRWPSGKVSASEPEGSRFGTRFHLSPQNTPEPGTRAGPIPQKIHRVCIRGGQTSTRWCVLEAWRGGASSYSSPDRDSKVRGPSQNSPRVALKRDVDVTKLSKIGVCF